MEGVFAAFFIFLLIAIVASIIIRGNLRRINREYENRRRISSGNSDYFNVKPIEPTNEEKRRQERRTNIFFLEKHGLKYGYYRRNAQDIPAEYKKKCIDVMHDDDLSSAVNKIRRDIEKEQEKAEEEKRKEEFREKKLKDSLVQWEILKRLVAKTIENSDSDKIYGVYTILCKNSMKFYIGSSLDLKKRRQQHLSNLRANRHHSYRMQKDFNEFGENGFVFYVLKPPYKIEERDKKSVQRELKYQEQNYIDQYRPYYNIDYDTSSRRHWQGNSKYRTHR